VSKKENIIDRIERRLSWVSTVSTPEQLREEIISFLKAQPAVCISVDVSVGEPLNGDVIEKNGVLIRQDALIIVEIICDGEKYEAHFRSHVLEAGVRIFFDLDLRHVMEITSSG
jgi:sugar-specific transcriptional regulator TrmB